MENLQRIHATIPFQDSLRTPIEETRSQMASNGRACSHVFLTTGPEIGSGASAGGARCDPGGVDDEKSSAAPPRDVLMLADDITDSILSAKAAL